MLKTSIVNAWNLFHRLKITFLIIFASVNFTFLTRHGFEGNLWLLLAGFTIQNFALHTFNNYFDLAEDELAGQRKTFSSPVGLLVLAISSTFFSVLIVWYFGFSLTCYAILFFLMLIYSIPVFEGWRIKRILFLKNLTGSLFWWYMPFILITAFHTNSRFGELFVQNLMILAIFLPFEPLWDIKDADGDLALGVRTIPNQYGLEATKLLVVSLFLLLAVLKLGNLAFVATFFLPLIILVCYINANNRLLLSQVIMVYVAGHTLGTNVLLPKVIWPFFKSWSMR